MNNDKRIIDIICDSLLPLAFFFLVIICIIILFTMPVHAASDQYYFPMQQNENGILNQSQLDYIDSVCDSENNYVFVAYQRTATYLYTQAFYYPKSYGQVVFAEIHSNAYQFSLYSLESDYGLTCKTIRFYGNTGYTDNLNSNLGYFQNLTSSMYSSTANYVSNFNLYTNNNTATRKLVLYYEAAAIPEDDTISPDDQKPIIDDYLPNDTTPPSFDDSSVEAALGSIFDYLQYETNKIAGTISGIGEFLSDSIMWGLQMVINNIRSKITEMVEAIGDKIDEVKVGIGSIIDNIEDFVDYIKEPVDKQAIETALEGTTLYSVSTIGSSIKNIFSDYFDSIPQPDTLVFNVPYTILTKSGYITIDFSWYPGIRSSVLPWIVGFLYAGFALAIFRSIPSIIHGVSGVLQKGG